jgi:hypothetical protein
MAYLIVRPISRPLCHGASQLTLPLTHSLQGFCFPKRLDIPFEELTWGLPPGTKFSSLDPAMLTAPLAPLVPTR